MNVMKKAGLSIAACGVAAVMVGMLTASGIVPKSAGGVKSPDPVTVEQTDAAGVSLTAEPLAPRAGEAGAQEVTAEVEPATAFYDLEWSLSAGSADLTSDSPLITPSISDYLSFEVIDENTIELVCHQRFDGFAKLTVEDSYTGKRATADVSAWTYLDSGEGSIFSNGDFSTNTTGQTSWKSSSSGGKTETIDDWLLYSIPSETATPMNITLIDTAEGVSYKYTRPIMITTQATVFLVQECVVSPGEDYYLVAESSMKPDLFRNNDQYTVVKSWYSNGTYVCKFHVNSMSLGKYMVGIGGFSNDIFTGYTVNIKSVNLYESA